MRTLYLNTIDYDFKSDELNGEDYVSHPVNAFHLMKRTSSWMPMIKQQIAKLENSTEQVNQNFGLLTQTASSTTGQPRNNQISWLKLVSLPA